MSIIKILRSIISAVIALCVSGLSYMGTTIGFTDGEAITANQKDYRFDDDRLLIGGYCFDMSDKNDVLVDYAKQAGLDFVVTGGVNESFLDSCDDRGLGAIVSGYCDNTPSLYFSVPDDKIQAWLSLTKGNYGEEHPCIWGDNLIDEPSSEVFGNLAQITSHYDEINPDKIAYINLFPIYAGEEQLMETSSIATQLTPLSGIDFMNIPVDRYKQYISDYINTIDTDYICVDIYPLQYKVNEDGTTEKNTFGLWLRNLDIISEACRKTNRDLWVITQAAGNTPNAGDKYINRHCDTPEDIRWQAYTSLAFGTKAIIHGCYYGGWWDSNSHMIDSKGERTDTYYAVQKVDNELAAFADIYGDYECQGAYMYNSILSAGNETKYLMPVDEKYMPTVVTSSPILSGCFTQIDGQGSAFVFVNMWEPETGKNASGIVKFDGAKEITVYRNGVSKTIKGDTLNLSLDNCEGIFVTVK